MRDVVVSEEALRLFRKLPKSVQANVKSGIRVHLQENDATEETRNKFRLRRPSPHAEYELRLGEVRVYYRVRDDVVEVLLVGQRRGSRLLIGGVEFAL